MKASAEAGVDALMQGVINYYFDPSITTVQGAIESIDMRQVGIAFISGLLPGGRAFKSGVAAAGDVLLNYLDALSRCEVYTPAQALRDFAISLGVEYIGDYVGDWVAKWGTQAVSSGLRRLGFDELAEKLLRNGDEVVDDVVPNLCSFSEETLVATEEGYIAISDVEIGDQVLAYNESTGEIGYYPVAAVWEHEDPVIVYLTIDGETIETTPEHPFYTTNGEWVPAGELHAGSEVYKADGSFSTVENVAFVYQLQPMYNLTVATAHTYFVGDEQWLVHNSCLNKIQDGVAKTIRPYLSDIKRLAPDAQVGFRGSLARGTKGPHKGNAPFDPSNFDVDAFIISDQLASQFSRSEWFRSGSRIPELDAIQQKIGTSLREQFAGLRDGPFDFRIWTQDEFYRKVKPDEQFFINP